MNTGLTDVSTWPHLVLKQHIWTLYCRFGSRIILAEI